MSLRHSPMQNTSNVNRKRFFGFLGMYIMISFLLCTVVEQKYISSSPFFRWSASSTSARSSDEQHDDFVTPSNRRSTRRDSTVFATTTTTATTDNNFDDGTKEIIEKVIRNNNHAMFDHESEHNHQQHRDENHFTRINEEKNRQWHDGDSSTTTSSSKSRSTPGGASRHGLLYQEHEISASLSNLSLADLGIRPEDPICVFFSETPMCSTQSSLSAPGDVTKIKNMMVLPRTKSANSTSTQKLSRNDKSSAEDDDQYHLGKEVGEVVEDHRSNDYYDNNSDSPVIALMVPLKKECSLEHQLRNIVTWYQKDCPDIKIVMFYDPIVATKQMIKRMSDDRGIGRRDNAASDATIPASDTSLKKKAISSSAYTSSGKSKENKENSSSFSDITTIVPFFVSRRTVNCFKSMIDAKSYARRRKQNQQHDGDDVGTKRDHTTAGVVGFNHMQGESITVRIFHKPDRSAEIMSRRPSILPLVKDIGTSIVVTVVSLILTGILLLVCCKDALSIEITREGIFIISNARYSDEAHTSSFDNMYAPSGILPAETVLDFPVVTFGTNSSASVVAAKSRSDITTTSHSYASSSCTPIKSYQSCSYDEESPPSAPAALVKAETPGRLLPRFCCPTNSSCPICLEDYKKDEKLRLLPCGHAYHTDCILPWLTTKSACCPLCKKCLHSELKSL